MPRPGMTPPGKRPAHSAGLSRSFANAACRGTDSNRSGSAASDFRFSSGPAFTRRQTKRKMCIRDRTSPHFLWLAAASGLTGILVGDACLYAGALRIGLRPAQVCLSLSAAFTAIIGAMFLGERIGLQGALGIGIATAGVILVVASERGDAHNPPADRRVRARGDVYKRQT